jgi:hypothetical protein
LVDTHAGGVVCRAGAGAAVEAPPAAPTATVVYTTLTIYTVAGAYHDMADDNDEYHQRT